ncbi:MAG: pyridoxal-phosphate dependent enzyme [Cloacibacterium sp.]|nr:pyridoxal-phosphate dependent enzyme [Cloacibacterium sp.]
MNIPDIKIPIIPIEIELDKNIQLFIKREDLIHPEISGNKFWKMFYNINSYLQKKVENPSVITFGGAYSNHIAAAAAVGKEFKIETMGIIRGDELSEKWQENPTLLEAHSNGMTFRFVTREEYRNKEKLSEKLQKEFPQALIVPEGGTNKLAVEGVSYMLNEQTKDFNYLCSAVGTGGTVAGIAKFAGENQKILGFKVVNDSSLESKISELSEKKNFQLFEAHDGGYGKIIDENIRFINMFYQKYKIPLDPIYTGKMMRKLFELIENGFFPENSTILAFHTGGLQGILGANKSIEKRKQNIDRNLLKKEDSQLLI